MTSSLPPKGVPASAGLARQLYGEGVPLAEIARRTGLSSASLYYWIDRKVAQDGAVVVDPLPRRRPAFAGRPAAKGRAQRSRKGSSKASGPPSAAPRVAKDAAGSGAARARLLARLWRAAERQVQQIEARISVAEPGLGAGAPKGDAEKDAKALALLTRTLRELAAIEDEARAPRGRTAKGSAPGGALEGDEDGADVRDRDAFRRELARRLDLLRGAGPGEDAA